MRLLLFLEVESGGGWGGRSPPHLLIVEWEEREKREGALF